MRRRLPLNILGCHVDGYHVAVGPLEVERFISRSIGFNLTWHQDIRIITGGAIILEILEMIGSLVMPSALLSTSSAVFPPSNRASAWSRVALHSIGASVATVKDFHFTG